MATFLPVPDRHATGSTPVRSPRPGTGHRRRARSLILPGLALAVATGLTVPTALLAQDTPPPSQETATVPQELREAMERLRTERAALMELMQEFRDTDQAALREFMREFRDDGLLLGLQQQRRQGTDGAGMQQRRQGTDGAGMQQRRQGTDGAGMQQQRRQGAQGAGMQQRRQGGVDGAGMQRQGQQPRQGLRPGQQDPEGRGQRVALRDGVGRTALMPGVRLHALNPDLGRYFDAESGVLVLERHEDSFLPVEAGDVIVTVNGREVEDEPHLRRILMSYRPGDSFALEVVREGRRMALQAQLPLSGTDEG